MSEQKYPLIKEELERLSQILNIAAMQEEILQSITARYKSYLVEKVFGRLQLKSKLLPLSAVDLREGQLIIKEPKNVKETKDK